MKVPTNSPKVATEDFFHESFDSEEKRDGKGPMVICRVDCILYCRICQGNQQAEVEGRQNPVYIRDMYTTKEHPTTVMGGGTRTIKL